MTRFYNGNKDFCEPNGDYRCNQGMDYDITVNRIFFSLRGNNIYLSPFIEEGRQISLEDMGWYAYGYYIVRAN